MKPKAPHFIADKSSIAFVGLVAFTCIFRIYLAGTQSYWAFGGLYDDTLQNMQALDIMQGNWLGEYGQNTLIKGIAFPVFLALSRLLHIPYGIALGIFICASSIIFLMAVRKICKNKIVLFIAFCALLFCPIAWCVATGVRIYRNVLSPWVTLAVFSCLIALFEMRHERLAKWLPWLATLGLALAFMANLREDSAWIYPALAITLFALLGSKIRSWSRETNAHRFTYWLCCVGLLLIPVAVTALSTAGLAVINHHYYGSFIANDRTQGAFPDMIESISAIESEDKDARSQWVTKDMIAEAMDASPTMDSIRDEIDNAYEQWSNHFGDGTIKGDYLQWVMRTAMSNAGLYDSIDASQEFTAKAARELDSAFERGDLKRDALFHPSSQGPGLSIDDCISFIPDAAANTMRIVSFSTINDWFPLHTELPNEEVAIYQQTTGLSFSNESQDAGHRTFRIESLITTLYQFGAPILFFISIALIAASVAFCIRRHSWQPITSMLFDGCITFGSALLCIYIVTIFITFLDGIWTLEFYATPAYILLLLFDTATILCFARTLHEAAGE